MYDFTIADIHACLWISISSVHDLQSHCELLSTKVMPGSASAQATSDTTHASIVATPQPALLASDTMLFAATAVACQNNNALRQQQPNTM